MADRTCRVGVHGRNNVSFGEPDYAAIRNAKLEALKMMSQTRVEVFKKIKEIDPNVELITRLYDDRFGTDTHPSPEQFVERHIPVMQQLRPYCVKFEIHNEPNHLHRYEGWGQEDQHAQSFNRWFLRVFELLKNACPWSSLGFPGLAIPHRDLEWIEICRPSVERADWLGIHCYWQTPRGQERNHLVDFWGLRFKYYHEKFPNKTQEITECGNSNIQANPPIPISEDDLARQYVEYFQELFKYPYINSAAFFLLSSQDPTWDFFAWRKEDGRLKPVVNAVGRMPRGRLVPARVAERRPEDIGPMMPEDTRPKVQPGERFFELTGQKVKGAFLQYFDDKGLDVCGYPITAEFKENGLNSQYFQRIGMEEVRPGQIRLKLIGTEALALRERISELEAQLARSGGAVAAPAIKNIVRTLPQHPTGKYPTRSTGAIKRIVIHHTALPASVGADRIARVQVDRGRPAISYHYFIGGDGTVFQTSQLTTTTEHTTGHNSDSLAIALAGDFTNDVPTEAQIMSGAKLIAYLMGLLAIPTAQVLGAKELVATQSPGNQWDNGQRWKSTLIKALDAARKAAPAGGNGTVPAATQAELERLGAQIKQFRTQIDQLQSQLRTAAQSLDRTRTELSQARASAGTVPAATRAQLDQLVSQVGKFKAEVTRLQTQLAESRAALARTQAELAEARAGAGNGATIPTRPGTGTSGGPPIQDITQTLAHHDSNRYPTRQLSQVKQIVIHHTAVAASVGAERIAKIHVERGRPGISYHYFITGDSVIQQTNALTTVSDHTRGHSDNSVAIAFAGDFTAVIPTEQQLRAGGRLTAYLLGQLGLSTQAIKGASELINTQSPGQQWEQGQRWKDLLLAEMNSALAAPAAGASGAPVAAAPVANRQIAALQQRIAQLEMELALRQAASAAAPPGAALSAAAGVTRPNIQDVVDDLTRNPSQRYASRFLSSIQELVIHHSAVPASVGAERIADYHVNRQDWPGIGYHFFLEADGTILQTNPLDTVAFHVKGVNATTVGLCFAGDFSNNPPTSAQVAAGAHLLAWLLDELKLPLEAIKGHKDYLVTECPGKQWEQGARWRDQLLAAVEDVLAGVGPSGVTTPEKRLRHAVLLWQTLDDWARQDLTGSLNYIGRFRPIVTFSQAEAAEAEYVTIVGGPLGVSAETEAILKAAGCQVERIAGASPEETSRRLDQLATSGRRFLTLTAGF
jgi:N-acetyl-anhydromuramyl-L-alanine amidase AmpD